MFRVRDLVNTTLYYVYIVIGWYTHNSIEIKLNPHRSDELDEHEGRGRFLKSEEIATHT